MSGEYIYMKVSDDEYQLPEAVADTIIELAKLCGTRPNCISSSMCHAKKRGSKSIYVRVKVK